MQHNRSFERNFKERFTSMSSRTACCVFLSARTPSRSRARHKQEKPNVNTAVIPAIKTNIVLTEKNLSRRKSVVDIQGAITHPSTCANGGNGGVRCLNPRAFDDRDSDIRDGFQSRFQSSITRSKYIATNFRSALVPQGKNDITTTTSATAVALLTAKGHGA